MKVSQAEKTVGATAFSSEILCGHWEMFNFAWSSPTHPVETTVWLVITPYGGNWSPLAETTMRMVFTPDYSYHSAQCQ